MDIFDREYWEHREDGDTIWWLDDGSIGTIVFSFDRKERFYLFRDYPWKLTKEQKEIFDRENPFWAEFFKDRQ